MKKLFKFISDLLFISGLLIAGIFLFGKLTGRMPISAYIVSSGSMQPAISTGSVVVVAPKPSYEITDIVTYYSGRDAKTTTTHRIVAASEGQYKMFGDANDQPDPVLVPRDKIIGSVRFSIPFLGYLAARAKTPGGFILLVIVPATIIIYEELKSLLFELKKMFGKKKRADGDDLNDARSRTPLAGVEHVAVKSSNPRSVFWAKPAIILPIFFALLIPLTLSISYFIDRETSSGNSFTGAIPTIAPLSAPAGVILTNEDLRGLTPTPSPDPDKPEDPAKFGSALSLDETPTPTLSPAEAFGEGGPLPTPTPTFGPNRITTPIPTP